MSQIDTLKPLTPEQSDLAAKYFPLVRIVARGVMRERAVPDRAWHDVESGAAIGLMRAAATWKPSLGEFGRYAYAKIRYAVFDELREKYRREGGKYTFISLQHCFATKFFSMLTVPPDTDKIDADDSFDAMLRLIPSRSFGHKRVYELAMRLRYELDYSHNEISDSIGVRLRRVAAILQLAKMAIAESVTIREQRCRTMS
jgi:RNA polymerase sigma factor (sigma-70 family)